MKTSSLSPATQVAKSYSRTNSLRPSVAVQAEFLETAEMETADVTFISQTARATAVKKGAGVMIGDYFVGVTTGSDLLFSHPVIVY